MPKAILSNRIYLDTTTEILDNLKKALTYKIKKPPRPGLTHFSQFEIIKNYKLLPKGIIAIPIGRVDLIPKDYEIVDKRINDVMPFPDPKLPLRGSQVGIYEDIDDNCFINAMVGFGKTFLALHIARKLGQKTLVVCHNTMLRDQWVEEVKKLYGMDCGVIGSGQFDIDHVIVVGNIQTLTKELPNIAKKFGTVIVDECLDYTTQVITQEHGNMKIGNIVNNKIPVHVLSLDPITGVSSYKKVLRYFKNPETNCLKITHSGGGSFKCTGNHNVYTYDKGIIEKVAADTLEEGDFLLQTTTQHKSTKIINKEWESIALGLILGDGNLGFPHSGSDSVRIRITHGQDQFDYLDWKSSIIGNTTVNEGVSGFNINRKIKSVTTKSFYDIGDWYNQLYVEGHKRKITKYISSIMDAKTWALLFQDDNSASQIADSIVFSVCELDETSVVYLQDSLFNVFNIIDSVQFICTKGHRYLRLNQDATLKFLRGINGLVHPQLQYKLNSIKDEIKEFNFPVPSVPMLNEHYCIRKITTIENSTLTGNYRYNIEVEDNHTYFANGILVANCHHVTATTFSTFLDGMYSKYKIGLSGTMNRKDGKHILFKDFFGLKLYQPPQENTLIPTIRIHKTGYGLSEGDAWATKINKLLYDPDYQELIAIIAAKEIAVGHKVLIIADRVEFLQKVGELIGSECVCIVGETTFEQRNELKRQVEDGEKSCIAGSRQIFSEGISVNILSCVILASPIANDSLLEQIIGRIQRMHPNKLEPLVIDMNFSSPSDKRQNKMRLGFYQRKGWDVV